MPELLKLTDYKDITVWENRRRLRELYAFHGNIIKYFNCQRGLSSATRKSEPEEKEEYRRQINLSLIEARDITRASRVSDAVVWSPPRAIGGEIRRIGLLDDLFYLDQYLIPDKSVVDMLEQSIGVYAADQKNACWRTFNPGWWIFRLLKWLPRIPFMLIGSAGFDAHQAESSLAGRLLKIAIQSVIVVAALITILSLIGWLDEAMILVGLEP